MKTIIFLSLNLILSLSAFANISDIEKKEALANIYGLYIEELENVIAKDSGLSGSEIGEMKLDIIRSKKVINSLDINTNRMFLNLDMDLMCDAIIERVDKYTDLYEKATTPVRGHRASRASGILSAKKASAAIAHRIELNTATRVQNSFCN